MFGGNRFKKTDFTPKDMMAICRNYLEQSQKRLHAHITHLPDRNIIHADDGDKLFIPSPTAHEFLSDDSFVCGVMGPYGSGKSTMCQQRIVTSTIQMPRWYKGRRKAKWAIIRNTSGELLSTSLQTWLNWFGDLGAVSKRQKPILTYEHEFNDGHGIIELEIIFLALDRPDDIKKLKSLELTGAYLNEASELPEEILTHIKGRVRRYPGVAFCPEPYWGGVIYDTNPPDEDHWICKLDQQNLPSHRLFKQPPGLIKAANGDWKQNPNCDNYEHLVKDYYTKMAEGQKEGFIKVYCLGLYGLVESGKRVYPEYNDDVHSLDELNAIQGLPIHLGFDFGLTPACIAIQMTPRGTMNVLKEYIAEDMGIRTLVKSIVLPQLSIDFPYNKIGESEGDPAGAAGDQIMEELSCIGELNSLGIKTNAASTNDFDVRSGSVRFFLNTMVDGIPGFRLSRRNCPVLRKGFISGYHFKRVMVTGEERYQDKANKNKYSHPHDALQYIAMKFAGSAVAKDKGEKPVENYHNPAMTLFA